jgi:hypothetical protein
MQRIPLARRRGDKRPYPLSRARRTRAVGTDRSSATAPVETLAPAFAVALPSLDGQPVNYSHEVNGEMLDHRKYPTGRKVTADKMKQLNILISIPTNSMVNGTMLSSLILSNGRSRNGTFINYHTLSQIGTIANHTFFVQSDLDCCISYPLK